jgi:hypothetical protein
VLRARAFCSDPLAVFPLRLCTGTGSTRRALQPLSNVGRPRHDVMGRKAYFEAGNGRSKPAPSPYGPWFALLLQSTLDSRTRASNRSGHEGEA